MHFAEGQIIDDNILCHKCISLQKYITAKLKKGMKFQFYLLPPIYFQIIF